MKCMKLSTVKIVKYNNNLKTPKIQKLTITTRLEVM